jgi:aminoglycoside/choline kinase family phosphotransferase
MSVSVRPAPGDLLPWALSSLGRADSRAAPTLSVVAGDASHRRYFRLALGERSYILAEAPPATEKNEAFLRVAQLLSGAGIKVPVVLDADLDRGFLLLEDLGDRLLLPALDGASTDDHYRRAFDVLATMAAIETRHAGLGDYDLPLLGEELSRFGEWFVRGLLGCEPDAREEAICSALFARLIDSALQQPRVLVHRDFHSRNLMLMDGDALAVIDFQDAVVGPITYDLVSLLRDCYIRWPIARVEYWALSYSERLRARGLLQDVDDAQWLRWFDWMGLQRHLKVLGTFARLSLRDGKAAYLDDLPRVLQYVLETLGKYAPEDAAFAAFRAWFEQRLSPLIATQAWSRGA